MARGNPQDAIFNLPWPAPMEFVIGITAWSPEECVVVTNCAIYRVDTPHGGIPQGTVSVRKIEGR